MADEQQPVQGPDGQKYQFPSGTTKEQAVAYFKKKGIGAKAAATTAAPPAPPVDKSFIDQLTEIKKRNPNDPIVKQAETAVGNIGAGFMSIPLHPIDTLAGIGGLITAPFEKMAGSKKPTVYEDIYHAAKENPEGFAESAIGQAAFGEAAGELAPRATRAAKGAVEKPARVVSGTGPSAVRDLVKETKEANTAIDAKNAKMAEDRAADVKAHFDKTQAVKETAEKRSDIATRKAALESGVRTLSDKFQGNLKAVREKATIAADAKYQEVNSKLGEIPGDADALTTAAGEALQKITGTSEMPKIFKDINKRFGEAGTSDEALLAGTARSLGFPSVEAMRVSVAPQAIESLVNEAKARVASGDPSLASTANLSYKDLQGYYSELGRELQRGTLPGDIYTAYSQLQDAIGEQMQKIADANGLGPQLTDARATWRNLKQTFYDPKSPLRKALDAKEAGGAVKSLLGKDRTGIEALAKYDPELAKRANTIRGYQEEAAGLRVPAESTKTAPELKPKPEPAPKKTIGTAEIEAAKGKALDKQSHQIRQYTVRAAFYITGLRGLLAVGRAAVGDLSALSQLPADVGEGIAIVGGGRFLADLLERPKVKELLTRPTPKDLAEIPPELRGQLQPIIDAAEKQGIQVSPSLKNAAAGALAPRQHPSDEWSSPQQ